MLDLVGGEAARAAVGAYSRALDDLYFGDTTRDPEAVAEKLVDKATAATEALRRHCIRHGVDDLHEEKKRLGSRKDWPMEVPPAGGGRDALAHGSRAAARGEGGRCQQWSPGPTMQQFHVGWRHFRAPRCDGLADGGDCWSPVRDADG